MRLCTTTRRALYLSNSVSRHIFSVCDDGCFAFVDEGGSVQRLKCQQQQDHLSIYTQRHGHVGLPRQVAYSPKLIYVCSNETATIQQGELLNSDSSYIFSVCHDGCFAFVDVGGDLSIRYMWMYFEFISVHKKVSYHIIVIHSNRML